MGDWTGTVPSHAAGSTSKASKLQTLDDIATALTSAWTDWTPTLTNLTLGNGTLLARYRRLNKTLDYRFRFTLGSTSAVGTAPQFTLPYSLASDYVTFADPLGAASVVDTGVVTRQGVVLMGSASNVLVVYIFNPATGNVASVTATVPFTFGTGDVITCTGVGLELA